MIGEWKQGEREGMGTFYYADGSRYDGAWHHNLKSGEGTFTLEVLYIYINIDI